MAKATTVALGAATAGVAALAKEAIDVYAEYEQLVGGVETLFGDSAGTVMGYAENAYKTAGMSANEYMNTVTSFSASLLQGLGGDTEEAAKVANRAITDMSDNANKMGTSMTLIQNAYQGFAKQNYTMLDNLKLGYGGTQAEMARLINDSGVLGDSFTATANNINEVSFDKIIEAIGVIQDRMGITGTTALEASTTIQGSIASMKAAWQNFLGGMADPTQDFDTLVANLVDSVVTVGGEPDPTNTAASSTAHRRHNSAGVQLPDLSPGYIPGTAPSLVEGGGKPSHRAGVRPSRPADRRLGRIAAAYGSGDLLPIEPRLRHRGGPTPRS